jgi:hypothetical protein
VILCTFPGKFGDLLWALPTVRAISETFGEPVDLQICQSPKDFSTILPLVRVQPYIGTAEVNGFWQPREEGPSPFTPRRPEETPPNYTHTFHLGYHGWPMQPLPLEIYAIAQQQYAGVLAPLDLDRPWITLLHDNIPDMPKIVIGFSDEWFELKLGVTLLLDEAYDCYPLFPAGSRWDMETASIWADAIWDRHPSNWLSAAAFIKRSRLFLGCCSALHVLSCAMDGKTLIMEPNAARHHPIFWPYGQTDHHPRVRCVLGGDGKPTFDARHVREAVQKFL